MTGLFEPVTAVLAIPALAAALLAALPVYRLTATLNVIATFLTFLAAVRCSSAARRRPRISWWMISTTSSSC
jgi:hydrogenase-4 component F